VATQDNTEGQLMARSDSMNKAIKTVTAGIVMLAPPEPRHPFWARL